MASWQYFVGHVWRYDGDDVPAGMEVRFEAIEDAQAAGLCGCECGVCGPDDPHAVDDGCVCTPLACPCLDQLSDPDPSMPGGTETNGSRYTNRTHTDRRVHDA
jgi:hypothetical protein